MKKLKSITVKLFFLTFCVFIIFISSTLVVQSNFFEKFYINKKTKDFKKEIIEFKSNFNNLYGEENKAIYINDFEDKTNSKIVIMDAYGQMKIVRKSNNYNLDQQKIDIITNVVKFWIQNKMNPYEVDNKTPLVYVTKQDEYSMRYIISALPNNARDEVIFVVASLQPVNEAVQVIKEFYFYFYVSAIFLVLILSIIFSNSITKPLKQVHKTAIKMAELDFSEKCTVKSEDEIGVLAKSLNTLSENLQSAMESLKAANTKLEKDILTERKMEKMRKEFVAAVSHELKTPITLIEGYAEGLKDEVFEGEDKDYYLDVIIDESRKMGNLVKDMLDLSQLESGTFKLNLEEVNLTYLAKGIIKKLLPIINDKKINISFNEDEEIKVSGDWVRLEQVITNFLTNAIRHTGENGVINVHIKEDDVIKFEVENSGPHIIEEELDKIWDKFYKVDKSRNRKFGGTGLGLAIVKNIITLHHGECGAENTDIGVKFNFTLPKKAIMKSVIEG